jgi:hypothetical protein
MALSIAVITLGSQRLLGAKFLSRSRKFSTPEVV